VSLFFLGGIAGVADAAAKVLITRVPGLKIAGTHEGFFQEAESETLVTRINDTRPDILLVGLGSPRQEEWVDRWHEYLDVPVCWSVGALFDYFAEREPRAPRWLCRYGGEWIFRLMHRPSERWRRYLVGNARFVWTILGERFAGSSRSRMKSVE
jgi:N-acetylglucosaminyldiphosphoundecaprenol N-acetyl-beta-D-mannosaminyltransferase